jgi:enoyl-CoA hydratase
MGYKNVLVDKQENIATVTISRPQVLNALNDETISELIHCFSELQKDAKIIVIILTGSGEKAFVSGADINELKVADSFGGVKKSLKGEELLFLMENMDKVVIGAINGYALGGGCELALGCDIRIASENAKLGLPEVSLGVIPGYGGTQRLPRLVGLGKAKELIFTGDLVDAQESLRIGLVEKVVPLPDLLLTCKNLAAKIATKGPLAIKIAKKCINLSLDVDLKTGCDYEATQFGIICSSQDKVEGTSAFLEKRKPNFTGT